MPLDTLHLTVGRLAFTDELPVASLETTVAVVKQHCHDLTPFRLQVGWLAGSTGALRFTVLPVKPIVDVRGIALAQSAPADTHKNVRACSTDHFWPAQPTAPIAAKIEALRSLPPAEVLMTSLSLVELRRQDWVYRWDELERVGIGA